MIPELGHFSLILALGIAVCLSVIPLCGTFTANRLWMSTARPLASGLFVFVSISFALLAYSFITDDFSVAYVAGNSNSQLPIYYKFSAVWGGHEGSLLLWMLILSIWTIAVSIFSRNLPLDMLARVLAVMGMISVGFLLFMLLTSNPFDRLLPFAPTEGKDLNPLLQDFGLVIHPPMLYFGYVGFSVAFSFAIAALLSGRLDAAWARWSRPWTNLAWSFLTVGIALGSWWAYYELGWGGWWFWDPVENASFMPWLVGTALIHSLAITEKRGAFRSWTLLLAIFAFSLSLLGTFLVRSGVLTSVHSFAADPERGLFILVFLSIVVGGSLTLYAFKAPAITSRVSYSFLSREIFLLLNNIVLTVAAVTVLLGTLYPLIIDALKLGKISVGPPYFNALFVPLAAILFVLLGIGPMTRWKKSSAPLLAKQLGIAFVASVTVSLLFPVIYGEQFNFYAQLGVFLGVWIFLTTGKNLRLKLRNAPTLVTGLKKLTPSYYAMLLAHLGMSITIVGIGLTSQYSQQRDLRMVVGDTVQIEPYIFRFDGVEQRTGPNYTANVGTVAYFKAGGEEKILHPEKRHYPVRANVMTEAAIDPGLFRDIYIALGEPLENGSWAVRVQHKPFVRWIWLGAILMASGGLLTLLDKRYRQTRVVLKTSVRELQASSQGVLS